MKYVPAFLRQIETFPINYQLIFKKKQRSGGAEEHGGRHFSTCFKLFFTSALMLRFSPAIFASWYMVLRILLFVFLIASPIQGRVLTYDEAINIALHKSYTIKSFQQDKLASQFYFNFYRAMFKPRIDFGLSLPAWNEMVTPIQQPDGLPVYNSTGSMRFSGDLSFTYMLPTGGNLALSSTIYRDNLSAILASQDYKTLKTNKAYSRLAISFNQPIFTANKLRENLREAKYYHERSSSRFTRGQMDIIYEVTKGFYTLYRATREVEIANEKLKNAQDALKTAQILSENGRIPEVDVLITKVDLAESQANLSENMNKLEREKDSFKNLIGLSIDEDIRIITDLKYEKFDIDMDKAIHSALKYRLELRESNIDIELQKIEVNRAKRFTEFSGNISAYYDFTGVSTIESRSTRELFYSSFDNFVERRPNRGITLTLSYPIFDWGRGSARVQEQKAKLRNRELDLENTRSEITREVRDIVRSVEEAKNRLSIYEQNQQVAELTYRISKMRFESGDINSRELALEQERLSNSRLAYLNSYITYQLTVADLKRKTLWDFYNGRSYLKEIDED